MKEYLDIVDEKGNPTGNIVERSVAHGEGIPHRTSHLWLLRRKNGRTEILLQKRAAIKSFPGCYDISSAGHIPAGDDYVTSALRELKEELGITAEPSDLVCCGDRYIVWDDVFFGKPYHDRQYTRVFLIWVDMDEDQFTLQEEEVESVLWMDLDQCIEGVKNNSFDNCIAIEELMMVQSKAIDDIFCTGMTKLKYGNTNTFLIQGSDGGLLIDTDYAGTLPALYKALKQDNIRVKDIQYVLATHYHPDHMGLISELMKQGVRLLLIDTQKDFVHYSDRLFARDKLPYTPIDETLATVISCGESRDFLIQMGIPGEILRTASHSEDSVSLLLDNGDCFVGDLEPFEYIESYGENPELKNDWERILSFHPKRIFYSHRPERIIE